jgi:hypothetical protein
MRHFPLRELGYAIGSIMLLAALYVGSYYAMVERAVRGHMRIHACIGDISPKYRFAQEAAEEVFRPLHNMDREIRPSYWSIDLLVFGK